MDFMHRTTGELRESADPIHYLKPEYVRLQANGLKVTSLLKTEISQDKIQDEWILNPDLSKVRNADRSAKLPVRYWKIPQGKGNKVTAMSQEERAAVDLALNPPDPEREALHAILDKPDADITVAERTRILLRMARKLRARGEL